MTKIEILENILELEEELEKVKAREIPDMKRETRVVPEIQSDGSTRLIETTAVWQLGDYEKEKEQEKKDEEIRKLQKEINRLKEEYKNTSEYDVVISKDPALLEKQKELEVSKLKENQDEENKDLNDLITVLRRIGMTDLANDLMLMPLAHKKMNSSYVKNEIEIQNQELKESLNRTTTRREYREIKSRVKRLTKEATKKAKKYGNLSYLAYRAKSIMEQIRELGIEYNPQRLKEYFMYGDTYHQIGHLCVKFYFDPANEYVRDRKKEPFAVITEEETRDMLEAELKEIEEENKDLDKLIGLLRTAGRFDSVLERLADDLYNMRFANKDMKSTYMFNHTQYEIKRYAYNFSKASISKKELKDVKKRMKRLAEKATKAAKKHKALYRLYLHASDILKDIEKKGIPSYAIDDYFRKERTPGRYDANLGYIYTEFARDHNSEYAKDSINHKI